MPSVLDRLLTRSVSLLEKSGFEYMVIGGFALPSYGAVRATVDLDIAVKIDSASHFNEFVARAVVSKFRPRIASFANSVCVFQDEGTGMEVELWLRPDGVIWDKETLRRRKRAEIAGVTLWLVSPEDFIVSKLARPDRGVQDEKDVAGIIARQGSQIDHRYLKRRASQAGVLGVLDRIKKAVSSAEG